MGSSLHTFESWVQALGRLDWIPPGKFIQTIEKGQEEGGITAHWQHALTKFLMLLEEQRGPWWADDMGTAHATIPVEEVVVRCVDFPRPPKEAWTEESRMRFQDWLTQANLDPRLKMQWERWALLGLFSEEAFCVTQPSQTL
jgi:hypothetical protein